MSGADGAAFIGLLASLPGVTAQSVLWFTVGTGLLIGVALQIAAAVLAAYLVITTIPAHHRIRHGSGPPTGNDRRGPWAHRAAGPAPA